MNKAQATCTILNTKGIHGRVATRLAEICLSSGTEITLEFNGQQADCSSILDVLSLAVTHGSEIHIEVNGRDAGTVCAKVQEVLNSPDDP